MTTSTFSLDSEQRAWVRSCVRKAKLRLTTGQVDGLMPDLITLPTDIMIIITTNTVTMTMAITVSIGTAIIGIDRLLRRAAKLWRPGERQRRKWIIHIETQ